LDVKKMLPGRSKMLQVEIKAGRLKEIRKARKIGRPKLAKEAGITERQLAKIETSKTAKLSKSEVTRLSQVLQIPSMTLTGEFPVSAKDLQPIYKSQCTSGCCS
jgi:transcriptional regulator with XRE-family HTH domain